MIFLIICPKPSKNDSQINAQQKSKISFLLIKFIEMQQLQSSDSAVGNNIYLYNAADGDTYFHSLILIKGGISSNCINENTENDGISLFNMSNPIIGESIWPVKNLKFKILCNLTRGANRLVLKCCGREFHMTVTYARRKSILYVIPIYIICQGSNGNFQAPSGVANTELSACKRIATGVKLVQCLMAEKLYEVKLGRKTFQLQNDLDDTKLECTVFYSKLTVDQARKMKEGELWEYFARELMLSPLRSNDCKFMAFISCTRYCRDKLSAAPKTHEDVLSAMEAHAALGGGGLALFGSACLHTWPETISNIIPHFMDSTKVDKEQYMDDSFYRGTYGGCFATTLGAVCHELGHTFDLGHSNGGIMGRGFDCVNLVFTLESNQLQNDSFPCDDKGIEQHLSVSLSKTLDITCSLASPIKHPIKCKNSERKAMQSVSVVHGKRSEAKLRKSCHDGVVYLKNEILSEDRIFWSKSCAAILAYHRWLNDNTDEKSLVKEHDAIKFDSVRKVMSSALGLRVIELRDDSGFVVQSWEFLGKDGKNIFILPSCSQHQSACSVVAEDSRGNVLKSPLLR